MASKSGHRTREVLHNGHYDWDVTSMTRHNGRGPTLILWHFTCDHGARLIGRRGLLTPHRHLLMPQLPPMVWLTNLAQPARDDVGLTSTTLTCDRLAHRYRVVDTSTAQRWASIRHRAPLDVVLDMEAYGRPSTWWVSFEPVRADRFDFDRTIMV
jgi:hypothetical protein